MVCLPSLLKCAKTTAGFGVVVVVVDDGAGRSQVERPAIPGVSSRTLRTVSRFNPGHSSASTTTSDWLVCRLLFTIANGNDFFGRSFLAPRGAETTTKPATKNDAGDANIYIVTAPI